MFSGALTTIIVRSNPSDLTLFLGDEVRAKASNFDPMEHPIHSVRMSAVLREDYIGELSVGW